MWLDKEIRFDQETRIPGVEEIHARLLEMMRVFHHFCQNNHITYYAVGGTALGARRHKGFIPWDDDMDIGIPREEFDRLFTLADRLPAFLEIQSYNNREGSPFHFIKLVDRRTTLIEGDLLDYVEGLYIDIFPLDGAGPQSIVERFRWIRIWILRSMIMVHATTKHYTTFMKIILSRMIKRLNVERLHKKLEKALRQKKFDSSAYCVNFLGAWLKKEVMRNDIMGKPTLYDFEDMQLYGPEKMDEYLTCLYGNFMQLPPPEERVCRHNFHYLDLDLPFREYLRVK